MTTGPSCLGLGLRHFTSLLEFRVVEQLGLYYHHWRGCPVMVRYFLDHEVPAIGDNTRE